MSLNFDFLFPNASLMMSCSSWPRKRPSFATQLCLTQKWWIRDYFLTPSSSSSFVKRASFNFPVKSFFTQVSALLYPSMSSNYHGSVVYNLRSLTSGVKMTGNLGLFFRKMMMEYLGLQNHYSLLSSQGICWEKRSTVQMMSIRIFKEPPWSPRTWEQQ